MPKSQRYTSQKIMHLCISLFFMFVFGLICPTWGPVTRLGVQAIGIFIGGIWMIAQGFGMVTPSLLIMFSIVLTGFRNGKDIIAQTLGSETVWQLIVIFVVLYALTESGADAVLARKMISSKVLNGKPVLFTVVFFIAMTALGALASALGAYMFSIAMIDSIANTVGYDNKSQWKKAMYTGAIVTGSVGGGILPFKGMALMIFNLLKGDDKSGLLSAGVQIDQVSYMLTAIIAGVLIAVAMGISIGTLYKADFAKLRDADVASITSQGGTTFNKRQKWTMGLFVTGVMYSVVMIWLPHSFPGYEIINGIGQGFWFVFMAILMFFIHIDGEPLLNLDRSMGKAVNWGIVLAVCAFTALGMMVSDKDLGVRMWLADIMNALFGNMPFPMFVVVLVLLTMVCTNVFSNTATAVIIGTVVGPLLVNYGKSGVNVSAVIPGIVMSALCAFITMAAGGSAPLFLGTETMQENQGWILKWGMLVFPIVTISSSIAYISCAYIL
ncbi:hypothetical protein BXO88_10090 [Oribacterium sp. C9]|uniref:hypothetical protein n=1 Tax=Oribacterium sp. C9 TaxID=1943579 RepID=UPI00098FFC63|nr:hypothetical protein [Oribacterium sp. C9]OON85967.1 hypothetical protein BXO88_10090 [Oribacterium sp. C9]